MKLVKEIFQFGLLMSSFIIIAVAPTIAFAENGTNVDGLFSAITAKNYPLAIAFGFSIIVFIVRKLSPDKLFPPNIVPYVVLIIAIISGVATGIIMSDDIWYHGMIKGLLEGLTAGLMSMGIWSGGLKSILKSPMDDQNA